MSTGVKFTKSGIPVPLDSFGNEMCLLFIKYGRCRFKKKCKKSHWTPPLPDEEYPKLPPLPLSSPPCPSTVDSYPSSKRINMPSELSGEERQILPATDMSFHQTKCTAYIGNDNIGLASTESPSPYLQGFIASQMPENQQLLGYYTQEKISEMAQPLGLDMSDDIQTVPDPVFTCNSSTSSRSMTFTPNFQDLSVKTTKPIRDSECSTVEEATPVSANMTVQRLEKTIDKMVQEIYQEKYRFDSVYHPKRPAKGSDWRYQSNTDQSYKHYGAYYDRLKEKLQVKKEPRNKAEKKRLKLLRKAHWNTSQVLKTRLAQLPPSYSLNVNFARVNFNRLRPYFYLLVQQCFVCVEPAKMPWRPTGFSCLVADTLIAFFTNCNITPVEAEKKMLDWGARPVGVRQCISHMWSIIVKSSLSTAGVAQEVVACENQVFAKKLCAVDYAYACSLAAPVMKANVNMSTPTVTKSVRQGIQAAKKASHIGQKPKSLKLQRVGENVSVRMKSATVEKTSTTLNKGVSKTEGVSCEKKRRTRRSRQLSLLDQQGKQDLQKRCKTILDNIVDCT